LTEALAALEKFPKLEQVYFVVYSARAREIYVQVFDKIFGGK